ncbi:hypothetical protein [Nocardia spumae]|uniref:hypothetical protein n=1 Tax=Nocardia spumae TaxID=2887190 RepID=UPI001D15E338|nr:hypothetical protein [Nocardia spumae]
MADGERIEITHLTDREKPIDTARFANHRPARYSCDGVAFAAAPILAVAHFLAPEYHALWCAVSEQYRRRFSAQSREGRAPSRHQARENGFHQAVTNSAAATEL